jgi:putative nucleotidyltransferase with HDIG domain
MISAFKRQASLLQLISPVKSYSEYTYTHAINVSVLALFQAESLGVKGQLLHDIGIAALLHDVGKIFVSKEVLEKQGSLEEREWEEMRRHTVYGARYLSKIDALPHIAPIVALEHHMRYDGEGYPRMKTRENHQHLCSQMVALSDFFDALRSKRPYKKDWQIKEIISLMKANEGKEFNAFLVDNFARIMSLALKAA